MGDTFDPYSTWLGIPREEQPPNYYRLLGIQPFESNRTIIESAADLRLGNLHAFQRGEHAKLAIKLLNEVSAAKVCLLNTRRKAAYDLGLRQRLQVEVTETKRLEGEEQGRTLRFLALLQAKDLLPAEVIAELRAQLRQFAKPLSADAVAQRLINKGYLTPVLAKRLLAASFEESTSGGSDAPSSAAGAGGFPGARLEDMGLTPLEERWREIANRPTTKTNPTEEDDLGFAPLDNEERRPTWQLQPDEQDVVLEGPLVPRVDEPEGVRELPQGLAEAPTDVVPFDIESEKTEALPEARPLSPRQPVGGSTPGRPVTTPPVARTQGRAGSPGQKSSQWRSEESSEAGSPRGADRVSVGGGALQSDLLGPLDGLLDSSFSDAAEGSTSLATPASRGLGRLLRPRKIIGRKSVWDSPLMLVGGGVVLALLILLGVLIWAVTRQSGDEALHQAHEDYRAERYAQAIHKYDQYLERFPSHAGVSTARVNRGLAQMRQATARGTTDWPGALQTAKDVLNQVASEDEFHTAQGEVAAMLLTIAEGLAGQARQKLDPTLVLQARESLALISRHAQAYRRMSRSDAIEATLAVSEHDISRAQSLAKSITAIQRAVAQGDARQAYGVRQGLVKQFPALAEDGQLKAVMSKVSEVQKRLVQWVAKEVPAAVAEPESRALVTATLADRVTTSSEPGVEGHVIFALAEGAAYGLEAATGKVLWRRYLGFASSARTVPCAPLPLSATPGSDALMAQPVGNEVLRVEAMTGRARWRHLVGERFHAHPTIVADRILVPTLSGRLLLIDATTGNSGGFFHLPQPLTLAPAVDPTRGLVYQIADHSNLFVLNLTGGRCEEVVCLGHEMGSVTAPPVIIGRFLVVAVNDHVKQCCLRVYSLADEKSAVKLVQECRLEGHVDQPPQVDGHRLLVTTDRGLAAVYELAGGDAKTPLRGIAQTPVAGPENLIRFPLLSGASFWIAGQQLTEYEIQGARSQLVAKWVADERSVFQQAPVVIRQTLYAVRRKPGMPGVFVGAIAIDEPKVLWETHLAAPLAAPAMILPGGAIVSVTAGGALFSIDGKGLGNDIVLDQPQQSCRTIRPLEPVSGVVALPSGLLACMKGSAAKEIPLFDPAQPQSPLSSLRLPEPLACAPLGAFNGILAPSQTGPIFLFDPRSGKSLAEPFQPPLTGGTLTAWRSPVVVGDQEILLTDGARKLYRLGIRQHPKPHLAVLGQTDLPRSVVSPIAVLPKAAYAVDSAGNLSAYELPSLKLREMRDVLPGPYAFGPQAVGNRILLSTSNEQLVCLNAEGSVLWQTKLPYGPLAGGPGIVENGYLFASSRGVVWRVEAETGKELGKTETGRPLATGVTPMGRQAVIGAADGCLYVIAQP